MGATRGGMIYVTIVDCSEDGAVWLHVQLPTGPLTRGPYRDLEEARGAAAALERVGHESTPGLALDLERAIAALPPGAREVFVLHDIEGYRHEEIAELTGIAAGTSKAQLFRARRLLREALNR